MICKREEETTALLKNTQGFWYLGSPYSKYKAGLEAAFIDVSKIAARLIDTGVPVY